MKITTWNINSIRMRVESIRRYIQLEQPDVLCLQETKVDNNLFPITYFKGEFPYIYFSGEKSYNGVAILSKFELLKIEQLHFTKYDHKRHISVLLPGDIELHNFYFPAGGDIPDIDINPKFKHKLDYISEVTDWFKINKSTKDKIILLGDLNVAPLENDVWSHKQLLNVVSHTPIEVEKLNLLYKSIGFHDAIRKFVPHEEKLYTWWSYRNMNWKKSNRGRRLDHIWCSNNLISCVNEYKILSNTRDFDKPSDHVPVSIKL